MAEGILNPIQQLEADFDFAVYTKQEVDALLDEKADKSDTYTKTETDALLDDKADADAVYTKTETDNLLSAKADADSVYTKAEIDTKIPSSVGSAVKPTYVNNGVITECTHELNKTVPANAVFTDTTYSAGNGLNLSGTSFSAKAGTNVTVDASGINVNGSGTVASADSGLVSGGTAYTELRPTLDGTWVKNAQTTAINLQKLEGGIEYLYAILSKQYDQLKKYINGNYYDYDTDTDSKYTKTVPQGAMPYASLDSIGGKTLVWNQLIDHSRVTETINGITFTNNGDGSWTVSGTASADASKITNTAISTIAGHNYALRGCPSGGSANTYRISLNGVFTGGDTDIGSGVIAKCTSNNNYGFTSIRVASGTVISTPITFYPQVTDLTLLYGSGNEPTTVAEFTAQFPASYYSYNAGTLLSAGVTEVVSKKADTTVLATYPIPADIQALTGYGWSAGSVFNYVDFERKVFVQRVGKKTIDGSTLAVESVTQFTNNYRFTTPAVFTDIKYDGASTNAISAPISYDYNSIINTPGISTSPAVVVYSSYRAFILMIGSSITDVNTMNTYLSNNPIDVYYELATPQEIDISAYITDDNLIEVEPNGTLTFPNSNGDDYRIPIPSQETYMVDLQASL